MQRYKCSRKVVKFLEEANLSLQELRLTHACLALTSWHQVRTVSSMAVQPDLAYTVRCLDVAAAAFPAGLKDLDPIHAAVSGLAQDRKVFERLEVDESRRNLTYRFSHGLIKAIRESTEKDGFLLLAPSCLGTFRSAKQVLFFTRVGLARHLSYPMFYLPGMAAPETSWTVTCRQWRDAARSVSAMTNDTFMLSPLRERFTSNVTAVAVKFSTSESRWSPGALYSRHDRDLPTIVDASGHKKLTKAEFQRRADWTRVSGP